MSVDELLQNRTHANEFSSYISAIEHVLLSPLNIRKNPRTGEAVSWKQVLAWCTRDQESHYEEVWAWRSPRSHAESLHFQRPKVDAVFIMRILLGLVAGDEANALQDIKNKETDRDQAKDALTEAKREPEYWNRKLTTLLCDAFNISIGTPIEDEGLFENTSIASRFEKFRQDAESMVTSLDTQIEQLQSQMLDIRRERQHIIRQLTDCIQHLTKMQDGAIELQPARQEIEQEKVEELDDIWICDYSQKMVRNVECWSIYQSRRERRTLNFAVAATEIRDAKAREECEKKVIGLRQETAALTAQAEQLRLKLRSIKDQSSSLRKERDKILRQVEDFSLALTDLRNWRGILANEKPYPRIDAIAATVKESEAAVAAAQDRARQLLASHKSGRQKLTNLFEKIVKAVISEKYSGAVILAEDDLRFQITRGPALGGEAVNTLSVLLADLTAVVASIEGMGYHPRFLIHDSPRESDLAHHIYSNFLSFVNDLEIASNDGEGAAFQYIVTTTTPPPSALTEKPPVQERLNAVEQKELLFRRILTIPEDAELIQQ